MPKYDFEGRELVIEDESGASKEAKALTEAVVLDLFGKNTFARRIRKATVVLRDNEEEGNALRSHYLSYFPSLLPSTISGEQNYEKGEIYLNTNCVAFLLTTKLPIEDIIRRIGNTFVHEIGHHLQAEISENERIERAAYERLKNVLAELKKKSKSVPPPKYIQIPDTFIEAKIDIGRSITELRNCIFMFARMLQWEGISKFIEKHHSGRIFFTPTMFSELYKEAQEGADVFFRNYALTVALMRKPGEYVNYIQKHRHDPFLASLDVYKGIEYCIGLHMTFTIVYAQKDKRLTKFLIDLLKKSSFDFIKMYEEAIGAIGQDCKPVVSLTSGSGILDYSRLVRMWTEMAEQMR